MRRRWAADMANVIVATGMQPSEYKALTLLEREQLIEAIRREAIRHRNRTK